MRVAASRSAARGTVTVFVQDDAPLKAPIARDDYVAYEDLPTDGSAVRVKVLENDERIKRSR